MLRVGLTGGICAGKTTVAELFRALGVPIVGTYSSALLLGEPVGLQEFGALVLVCLALMTVLVIPALRGRRTD